MLEAVSLPRQESNHALCLCPVCSEADRVSLSRKCYIVKDECMIILYIASLKFKRRDEKMQTRCCSLVQ